jgi:hypothetical protein
VHPLRCSRKGARALKLADLQTPEGVPMFAVIRADKLGESWLDPSTFSHTATGAADLADAHPGSREWKGNNPPKALVQLRVTLEPGTRSQPIPSSPARRKAS